MHMQNCCFVSFVYGVIWDLLFLFQLMKTHNHFRIELSVSCGELDKRLSHKGRYNLRRQTRLLIEKYSDVRFLRRDVGDVEEKVFDRYFALKAKTHNVHYGMSKAEYVKNYQVSHVYTLEIRESIIAIVLSCEQCGIVYIENITYDQEFAKYSPGLLLYDFYLKELIRRDKKEIYLAGGDLEYKRRYGSIENIVFDGRIYRGGLMKHLYKFLNVVQQMFVKCKERVRARNREG